MWHVDTARCRTCGNTCRYEKEKTGSDHFVFVYFLNDFSILCNDDENVINTHAFFRRCWVYWFSGTGKLSAICVSASATLAIALMSYGWAPLKDNVSYFYGTESNLSDYT